MTSPTPVELTPEQQEQLLATMAKMTADVQAIVQALAAALVPVVDAVAKQFAQLQAALQAAGLLDANGQPVKSLDEPAPGQDCAFEPPCWNCTHPAA